MRRTLIFLAVALAATSCDNDTSKATREPPDTRPQWSSPDAYTYEVESSCGERSFIGRFRIHVEAGDVRAVTALDQSARAAIDFSLEEIPTLEILLAEATEAQSAGADRVDIRRTADGRPRRIEIDYDTGAIDDEACYFVRRFTAKGAASTSPTDAAVYTAVIQRSMRGTHLGPPGTSLDAVYVVDGPVKAAGKPRANVFAPPREPFAGELVNQIHQTLAPQLSPLRWVGDVRVAVRNLRSGSVGDDTAVLLLGEIERVSGKKARVPVTWWCDKCSRWLTYVAVEKDGRWIVTGTTGPIAIS